MGAKSLWHRVTKRLSCAPYTGIDRCLIAFSGGLDSSVLVDIMQRWHQRGGPALSLIHVDHGLRRASQDDADFCVAQATERGLPIAVESLDFQTDSVSQAAARRRRLAAIADRALSLGIETVGVGHHGDDRIETFLFHLRRGTGLDGLAPMPASAPMAIPGCPLRVVRPLVDATRKELERYAAFHSVAYRRDPTNATDAYSRNRIRHHVVDRVAKEQSRRRKLLLAMDHLQDEREAADCYATELSRRAERPWPHIGEKVFDRQQLLQAPSATVARLFQNLQPALDADAIDRIHRAIAATDRTGTQHLTLRRCVVTIAGKRVLYQPCRARGGKDVLQRQVVPIKLLPMQRGRAPFFGSPVQWGYRDAEGGDEDPPHGSRWCADVDIEAVSPPLRIDGFRPGAHLTRRDGGRVQSREKLRTLLSNAGIGADVRWRWPCLFDADDRLLWAAGLGRSTAAIPDRDGTRRWRCALTPSDDLIEFIQY